MKMKQFYALTLFLSAIITVGCGGSNIPESTTTLNQEQADAMATSILWSMFTISSDTFPENTPTSGVHTYNVNTTVQSCGFDLTGSTATTGTFTLNADTMTGSSQLNVQISNCELSNIASTYTYNAEVSLTTNNSETVVSGSADISGENVSNGTCGISFSFETEGEDIALGSICDTTLSEGL